jgi:hypothetical protein
VPIFRAIDAHGGGERMMVAHRRGHLSGVQVADGLEGEAPNQRLQQRRLDPLSAPGALPLDQRRQDPERREVSRQQIADGDPDAQGGGLLRPRQGHEARHPLHDLVVAGPVPVRAALAEAGNARIDQPGVGPAKGVVIDPEAALHVGPVVLHDHVRAGRERPQDLHPLGVLEVQDHALLVPLEVRLVEIDAVPARIPRPLDVQHLRAQVGQDPGAGGPRAHGCEVHHSIA